jgi:hypothetical protein
MITDEGQNFNISDNAENETTTLNKPFDIATATILIDDNSSPDSTNQNKVKTLPDTTTFETTASSIKQPTGIESDYSTDGSSKTPSSRNLENPKVDQNLLLAGFSKLNISTTTSSEFSTEKSIFKELSTFPIKENSDEVSNDSSFTEKMTNSEINDKRRKTLLKQRLPNGISPNATDLIIDNDDREITLQKINSNQRLSNETLNSTIINNDDREMTLQKEDSNQRLPNETLNSTIINYDDGSRMVLQKEDSHQEPPNKTPNSTINNDDREKTLHTEDRNQILPNETLNSTIINYDDRRRIVLQKEDHNQEPPNKILNSTIINTDDREMTFQKEDSNQELPAETPNSIDLNINDEEDELIVVDFESNKTSNSDSHSVFAESSNSSSFIKIPEKESKNKNQLEIQGLEERKVKEKENPSSREKDQLEVKQGIQLNEKSLNQNVFEVKQGIPLNEMSLNQNVFIDRKTLRGPLFFYRIEGKWKL